MTNRSPMRHVLPRDTIIALSLMLGCGLLAFAVTRFGGQQESVAAVRLSSAWLLGILLLRKPSTRLACGLLLLGWIALATGVHLAEQQGWGRSIVLGGMRALEAALAYGLLRWLRCDPVGLRDHKDLAWLALVATLVAPLMVGLLSAAVAHATYPVPPLSLWLDWWIGGAFGMLSLLPLMLSATPERLHVLLQSGRLAELALLALLTVAIAGVAARWLQQPFVLLLLPPLLAAYRTGVLGTAVLNLLTVATLLVLHRLLPAGQLQGLAGLGFGAVAFYSALILIPPLLVSVLLEQRGAAHDALSDALGQLRLITDNVPALIGRLDRDGRYRFVNRAYSKLFGKSQADIIGRTSSDLLGPAMAASLAGQVERVLAGETVRFDAAMETGHALDVTFVPDRQDGQLEGYFVLAKDVTERKAIEQALFEEKERAQVTLDSIGDAVIVCDVDGRVTGLNPIAEDMTGWPRTEALGRPFEEVVRLIDLATQQPSLSPMAIAIREDRIVGLQLDSALQQRDGRRSPIEDSAAPIHDRDGQVIGGVMVFHDVSESRAMALKMSHQAQHDHLTDLPNRVLLLDRLAQALATVAQNGSGAVLFIDLDHFKLINDSLGHHIGDLMLQEVAHRLSATVRPGDTVSRQGGDEFVVLLARLAHPGDAARMAEQMFEAMQPPMEIEAQRLHVGLSVGIALFPQDSVDSRELLKQADTALYHAKQAGRGRFSYFAASMSEKVEQRLLLEHELRRAFERNELFMVYQPKVTLAEGRITGMEALMRWRRGDGRLVSPLEFIPIAEEGELIGLIDAWAMREACRQNKAWQDAGAPMQPVAVNVSLARLEPEHLLALVTEVLEQSGLAPQYLEIEFTESQMFADAARASLLIDGLRALQVRVAVDDFGTGYSNLGYLAQYRFDTIKIDRSFICNLPGDIKQEAIVRAIIAMARALDARVVAEGVETRLQADALELHGCHELQGYLYSQPLIADELLPLLRRGSLHAADASAGQ